VRDLRRTGCEFCQTAPLANLGSGVGHDEVHARLGTEGLHELLVLLIVAVLGKDAQTSGSSVEGLGAPKKDRRRGKAVRGGAFFKISVEMHGSNEIWSQPSSELEKGRGGVRGRGEESSPLEKGEMDKIENRHSGLLVDSTAKAIEDESLSKHHLQRRDDAHL
jgi:hypothetical protein